MNVDPELGSSLRAGTGTDPVVVGARWQDIQRRLRTASWLGSDAGIDLRPERSPYAGTATRLALAAVVIAGVLVRFVPAGPLWFDEAQSVGIARLPVLQLLGALRQDGSPPLYYLMLHVWMLAVGRSTFAVRSLSALFSVATLPVFGALARRLLPSRAQMPAVVLLAASPFAIRFADEARMYSLVVLLVAAGGLLLCRALEAPAVGRLVPLAGASGLLALTHYWGLFLLAVVGAGLAWRALPHRLGARAEQAGAGARAEPHRLGARTEQPRAAGSVPARRALVALLAGGILFLPWLPSMLFQVANTGTPWQHAGPLAGTVALAAWGGAMGTGAVLVVAVPLVGLLFLAVAAATARSSAGRRLAAVAGATIALAGLASFVLGAAVVPRYTSVGLVPYLLAAALGLSMLPRPWLQRVLAGAAVLGLVTGLLDATAPRTLAGKVAAILEHNGSPSNTVVYCPDQLGPDVARLLPGWYLQEMYPTGAFPDRVDWVDYAQRNYQSSPQLFAEGVSAVAGNQPVWLLEASNFTSYYGRCQQLAGDLAVLRPRDVRIHLLGRDPVNTTQREVLVEFMPGP